MKVSYEKVQQRLSGSRHNIRILNVGEGDFKVSFDPTNTQEKTNAKKVISDLLRQGFALMVEVGKDDRGPLYRRALKFDPATSEYIVMGGIESTKSDSPKTEPAKDSPPLKVVKGTRRVSMDRPVVAVGRTAGGYDPLVLNTLRRGAKGDEILVKF